MFAGRKVDDLGCNIWHSCSLPFFQLLWCTIPGSNCISTNTWIKLKSDGTGLKYSSQPCQKRRDWSGEVDWWWHISSGQPAAHVDCNPSHESWRSTWQSKFLERIQSCGNIYDNLPVYSNTEHSILFKGREEELLVFSPIPISGQWPFHQGNLTNPA